MKEGEKMIPKKVFAENLKYYMKAKHLNSIELSKLTNISRSHLYDMCNGTHEPTLKTLHALARGLEINESDLVKERREIV